MGFMGDCRRGSAIVNPCNSCKKKSSEVAPELRKLRVFNLQELARATNNFSTKNLLGKGSHACVYKAILDDGQVVAVKRPTIGRRILRDLTAFDNELEVLSELQHRHLVNLIGLCDESNEKLLVVEFMGKGTLFDLLHSSTEPLSWPLRVHIAFQAAKALLALHSASPPVMHRDVKSSNILVDKNWNAKLGDLGLALRDRREDLVRQRTPAAGTMGYIDPQYETPSQHSTKSDVFSFGILLLEIMSGRNAIDVRFNPSSILDWAVPLIRQGKSLDLCDPTVKPPQNAEAVKQLAFIAARAVRLSRDRRPRMLDVVECLRQIRLKLPIPRFFGVKSSRNTSNTGNLSDGAHSYKSDTLSMFDDVQSSRSTSIRGDLSDEAYSCKSDTLSMFEDEDSFLGEGNSSPVDSAGSSISRVSSSGRVRDFYVDVEYSHEATFTKRRQDLDDCNLSATASGERSDWSRRPTESPIFGTKGAVKEVNLRGPIIIVSHSALSGRQAFSRLKSSKVLPSSLLPPTNPNSRTQRELNRMKEVSFGPSRQRDFIPYHLPTMETNLPVRGQEHRDA